MAKARKKKSQETEVAKEEIIPEIIHKTTPEVIDEVEETDSIASAEKLQKAGWQLISVTRTSNGKLYKFKR